MSAAEKPLTLPRLEKNHAFSRDDSNSDLPSRESVPFVYSPVQSSTSGRQTLLLCSPMCRVWRTRWQVYQIVTGPLKAVTVYYGVLPTRITFTRPAKINRRFLRAAYHPPIGPALSVPTRPDNICRRPDVNGNQCKHYKASAFRKHVLLTLIETVDPRSS